MIPRKLAIGDETYNQMMAQGHDLRRLFVTVDGAPVLYCVAYDMDEGWAETYSRDPETGYFLNDGESFTTRRSYGRIGATFERPKDWPA